MAAIDIAAAAAWQAIYGGNARILRYLVKSSGFSCVVHGGIACDFDGACDHSVVPTAAKRTGGWGAFIVIAVTVLALPGAGIATVVCEPLSHRFIVSVSGLPVTHSSHSSGAAN